MSTIDHGPVDAASYPGQFEVDYPDRSLNRLTTFFRLFMVIPISSSRHLPTFPAPCLNVAYEQVIRSTSRRHRFRVLDADGQQVQPVGAQDGVVRPRGSPGVKDSIPARMAALADLMSGFKA